MNWAGMFRGLACSVISLAILAFPGCSKPPRGGPRVPTFPVRGIVTVDGKPAATLRVECSPVSEKASLPNPIAALTKEDGKFDLATYEGGDGVPAGEYRLAFTWGQYELISGQYSGDKLKKKYADPEKSEVKLTVKDKPVDLGEIKLTSQ